jgi:hypothetical protein
VRSRVVLITRMLMYNVPLLREGSTLFLFAKNCSMRFSFPLCYVIGAFVFNESRLSVLKDEN